MGFMDNVKSKATQAAAKAQESLVQGQEKFNELQARRASDKLLTDLGKAVWAHQRAGGSTETVNAVLTKLDAWVAEHGPVDTTIVEELPPESTGSATADPSRAATVTAPPPPPPPAD